MLTLTLENQSSFSDGSPVFFSASERSFRVGRASSMDWILPDPADSLPSREMRLSRQHFEILYENGKYWLKDSSTFGTFIVGRDGRIQGLEELFDGVRLRAGRYFIRVDIATQSASSGLHDFQRPVSPPFAGSTPPAFQNAPPVPPPQTASGVSNTAPQMPSSYAAPPSAGHGGDIATWGQRTGGSTPGWSAPPSTASSSGAVAWPTDPPRQNSGSGATGPVNAPIPAYGAGWGQPQTNDLASTGFAQPPMTVAQPVPTAPSAVQPPSAPPFAPIQNPPFERATPEPAIPAPMQNMGAAPMPTQPENMALLVGLATGMGLDPQRLSTLPPEELGFVIGRALSVCTADVMQLLQDRGSVKSNVVRIERTVYGSEDDNPLKFALDANAALETILSGSQGSEGGVGYFSDALKDLRVHQAALIAAIQKALLEMFEDLSPDAIEDSAENKGVLRAGKGRLWDSYCDRWDALQDRPNGILDAFLDLYSRHYQSSVDGNKLK
jgi:type VI secretion system FHA domain protein